MRRLLLLTLLAYVSLPASAQADFEIEAFGSLISWTVPDTLSWHLDDYWINEERGRGMVMYKRDPVFDSDGMPVAPVMAIVVEQLEEPTDVITYSTGYRIHQGWQFRELHLPGTATSYENAVVFDAFHIQDDRVHSLILGYMIFGLTAIQVICDSTEGVFDQVEDDMRQFVMSVMMEDPDGQALD